MSAQPTFSSPVALSDATAAKLDELARRTGRSRLALAEEAVAGYVDREFDVIAGVERGIADMAAGRVTPHDEAMSQIRATIADARKA